VVDLKTKAEVSMYVPQSGFWDDVKTYAGKGLDVFQTLHDRQLQDQIAAEIKPLPAVAIPEPTFLERYGGALAIGGAAVAAYLLLKRK